MNLPTIALLLAGLATMTAAHGQGAGVAKVNGRTIPQSTLDLVVTTRVAQGQADTPELRKNIREDLINRELVAQEAARKGLDKNPSISARIALERQTVLINAFFEDYLKSNPINEDMLKKEYERIKPQLPVKEYKARHILVEQEGEAKEIIAQLRKGASFEKLAAEKSKDQGTKTKGGDLDWGPATRYVKPFGDALARLKKGQITEAPVQTNFGWHVIRLDDERAVKIPSFEEARPSLQQLVQNQVVQKLLNDLRAKAKIE